MPPGAKRRSFQEAWVKSLAATDPDKAGEIARAETSPSRRADLLSTIGRALASSDPQAALEIFREISAFDEHLPGGGRALHLPDGTTFTGGVPARMAFYDALIAAAPAETMAIAEDLAASAGDAEAVRTVAERWGRKNPESFAAWLHDYQAGTDRDRMVVDFFSDQSRTVGRISDLTVSLLPLVEDPEKSGLNAHIGLFLEDWRDWDAEDFDAYLASKNVPEIIREAADRLEAP